MNVKLKKCFLEKPLRNEDRLVVPSREGIDKVEKCIGGDVMVRV